MRRLFRLLGLGARLLGSLAVTIALLALLAIGLGPPTGAYQMRTVLTGSMRPTMPEGSVVMTVPVHPSRLQVRDVITYRIPAEDRRIVTHRIVEIVEPGSEPVVRTQGDANNAPDPWVARLRGGEAWRVRVSVPKAGYVLMALRDPRWRRLAVVAASVVCSNRPSEGGSMDEPRPARWSRSSSPALVSMVSAVILVLGLALTAPAWGVFSAGTSASQTFRGHAPAADRGDRRSRRLRGRIA